MACDGPHGFGWRPDAPDHRDYTPSHPVVRRLLHRLKPLDQNRRQHTHVDWREYFGAADDQLGLATSSVHACVGMVQYFERRSSGRFLRPSRLFTYRAARRLAMIHGDSGVCLRATIKAVKRFGVPPERHWPYCEGRVNEEPVAFTYAFREHVKNLCYVRLDERGMAGAKVLARLRSFLAAGFVCALGFPVCSSTSREPELPFPTRFDRPEAGQAVLAVGYDDTLRVRSDKGALLVRNSWGSQWGDHGYGWLPYAFVVDQLAQDLWTLASKSWLKSGEFEAPE